MHWLAWENMYRGKSEGGTGFWTINDFNIVLLAKQLWRLIDTQTHFLLKYSKVDTFKSQIPWIQLYHIPRLIDVRVLFRLDL